MGDRYECNLSPELLAKAVKELNEPEDNALRLAAIDKLRTRFQEQTSDWELVRSDDAFFLRFLRVRKFDQERALGTLVNYHQQRTNWREVFRLVDNPELVADLISKGPIVPLQYGRAHDGSYVIIGRIGLGFNDKKDILRFFAGVVLTIEKLLENEELQIYGLTVVQNMEYIGFSTGLQFATYAKKFLNIMQEAMPVRVKSLNLVNEALVFDVIYAVVSKFMKDKFKRRLQLHGTNFATLHEIIDPAHLPASLGGTGSDLDARWWTKEITGLSGEEENTGSKI